jgi:hypothetical protein
MNELSKEHYSYLADMSIILYPLSLLPRNRCCKLVRDQSEMPAGRVSLRHRFPRL